MIKSLITSILLVASIFAINAQNTVQKGLVVNGNDESLSTIAEKSALDIHQSPLFDAGLLSIKGFEKRLADTRESFFVTNHSKYNISRVKLRLRYTDTAGNLLHERTEMVECELPSGSTRQVYIPSFDKQRKLYFYLSTKPRRQATAFRVAYSVLRYDIVAE